MNTRGLSSKRQQLAALVGVGALFCLGIVGLTAHAAQAAQKIEIVIQDGEAKLVRGAMLSGIPSEVSIRNEDNVTHGFNSSIFGKTDKVEMSGGTIAEGKGTHVYRVEPGRTMTLRFTLPDNPGGESRTYAFWCDLHRSVKGEMLLVEQSGETNG